MINEVGTLTGRPYFDDSFKETPKKLEYSFKKYSRNKGSFRRCHERNYNNMLEPHDMLLGIQWPCH